MKQRILIFILLLTVSCIQAQVGNNMCEGALPFCTGTSYSFPAGVNAGTGQTGPYYACLTTRPNPAWYYMKIALPGMIQITMHSEPSEDIDFCCWGPFDSQNACGQLTSNKVVDCSYSQAATEVVDIANAVQGKYYIMVITNFSNDPCNIIFSQTGGLGATDCTILPPAAANDGPLCVGEVLHLAAANMNNAVYHWTGPDGWTSNQQNPVRNNVQLSMAGVYSLFVTVNGQPSADTNYTTVGIYNKPTAVLSGGGEICQGDSVELVLTCQNHPPWTVTLTANGQTPVNIPVITSPHSVFVEPLVNTTYAISQVTNEICSGIGTGTAVVNVNPNPNVNFTTVNDCSRVPTEFHDVSLIPGGSATSWLWNFGFGGDTSNIQNPTFTYSEGGTYDVNLKITSNKGCKGQVTKSVLIHPSPVANAGNDKSIPYGTNTSLQGTASGGSGAYSFHWEPAHLLLDPNVQNPVTTNLVTTTDFVLSVSDAGNSCVSTDVITITITGGPMGVQLHANPPSVCIGGVTSINAQAGGGSGNYTYSWTSTPAGFSSTLEDITVNPLVTTIYTLSISDGFSNLTESITVTVYSNPVVNAGDPQSIPNGTFTNLSGYATGGALPFTYLWSPSSQVVNPIQISTNTTLLSGTTNFTLTVTDGHGCVSYDDVVITVIGGPLAVTPQAVQSPLCYGESTTLLPFSEGGSGNYSYNWTAPGGFNSTVPQPVVTPGQTTTYHLVIDDGFTQKDGNVIVEVNPLPLINLIPDGAHAISGDTIMACVFDTLTLSAANPNASYLWSNGAITPEIQTSTTGIAFDLLTYSVSVMNTLTSCSNDATLTILYTYGECSYGIKENDKKNPISVVPNPGRGRYTCTLDASGSDEVVSVYTMSGAIIRSIGQESFNDGTFSLDLDDQPAGIYLVTLTSGQRFYSTRIIKY